MSTDYSALVLVGYRICDTESHSGEQAPLGGHCIPEKCFNRSMDDRGNRETIYVFQDKSYSNVGVFLEAVAKEVGGVVQGTNNDEDGEYSYWIGPRLPIQVDGAIDYAKLYKAKDAIDAIGRDLKKLGFKVGKPMVAPGLDIG